MWRVPGNVYFWSTPHAVPKNTTFLEGKRKWTGPISLLQKFSVVIANLPKAQLQQKPHLSLNVVRNLVLSKASFILIWSICEVLTCDPSPITLAEDGYAEEKSFKPIDISDTYIPCPPWISQRTSNTSKQIPASLFVNSIVSMGNLITSSFTSSNSPTTV